MYSGQMRNLRLASLFAVFFVIKSVYASGGSGWDYVGAGQLKGPSHWTEVDTKCGQNQQSPIDIPYSGAISDLDALAPTLAGSCVSTNFTSDKPGMLWTYTGSNDCTAIGSVASKAFSLLQFHLHQPSEHKINGAAFDGEVHFVHQNSDGRLLVIGVLLQASGTTANSFMSGVLDNVPALISSQNLTDVPQSQTVSNARESFIPVSGKWFNYQGSLTTPTCDEIVDWWVAAEPVTISTAQFSELKRAFLLNSLNDAGKNARPTQDLNGREVRPIFTGSTSAGTRQSLFSLGLIPFLCISVFIAF